MATLWTDNTSREPTTIMTDDSLSISQAALYTILPSVVSKRIPRIPRLRSSLKQAFSNYDCTIDVLDERSALTPRSATYAKRISLSSELRARSLTPPPSYHSNPEDVDPTDEEPEPEPILYRSRTDSSAPSRPSTSGSSTPVVLPQETSSGVQWKYADAGCALLSLASQEASGSSIAFSSNLVRRQYIDGVACLLRGLPAELSVDEELSLREALPLSISVGERDGEELGALIRGDKRRGQLSQQQAGKTVSPSAPQLSALHRSVASATLYLFLAVAFVLPYLQLFLRNAYQWDRKHKVSDRVFAKSVVAADAVGKRTMMLATSFCAMNEGKVGDTVREMGVYLVQGVSGGVYEGVGEALKVRAREERRSG